MLNVSIYTLGHTLTFDMPINLVLRSYKEQLLISAEFSMSLLPSLLSDQLILITNEKPLRRSISFEEGVRLPQ